MARLFDDASSEYLYNNNAPITTWPIVMAASFYIDDLTNDATILSVGDHTVSNSFIELLVRTDGTVRIRINNYGTIVAATTTTTVSTNEWHSVTSQCWIVNGRNIRLDGGAAFTNTNNANGFPNLTRTYIGRRVDDGTTPQYFSGRIARAGVWWSYANPGEMIALSSGLLQPGLFRPYNCVGYWELWGDDSPEPDLSGSQRHMTLSGTPTQAGHAPYAYIIPRSPVNVTQKGTSVSHPAGGIANFDTYNENLTQSYPTAVSLGES